MTNGRKQNVQEYGYRAPRFRANFHFQLQTSDPKPRLIDAHCVDISSDGMAATIAESLGVGTTVTLMLVLPGRTSTVRIAARVNHQQGGEHGFVFAFSSQQERESIQKYLASMRSSTIALRRPHQQ
jgi:hypothetical protein